jgi:hypothetical protein
MKLFARSLLAVAGSALFVSAAAAQGGMAGMDPARMHKPDSMPMHMANMSAMMDRMHPAAGQAAFAAIQDIVQKLKADPKTDWSKVDLEGVRRHFIDMDNVFMRSMVKQTNIPGGMSIDVTGEGDVAGSIRRFVTMHTIALDREQAYNAKSSEIAGGVRLVMTLENPRDAKGLAMLRGLGFAGIMTEGEHHAAHHIALARGEGMGHHRKP